jgi:hypothetical protein
MMMSISPFGPKAVVGDLSGVSEMYSHQSHSPLTPRGFLAIHFVRVMWYLWVHLALNKNVVYVP